VKLETRVGIFILTAIGIFLYLSINIREIRLDRNQYYSYKAYFDDTGGLTFKAPVKIAGVEVGWVESIELLDGGKAEVMMRVNKYNKLAKNAYAMIHQDGLIGAKSLEIDPGDPSTGLLLPGSTLSMPGKTPASVGELLDQFRDIATTIHDIASSFKGTFATRQGEDNMRVALGSIAKASDRIADFSEVLQRTMKNNEETVNTMLLDFKETAKEMRKSIPELSQNLQANADKIVGDFGSASERVSNTFIHVEDASIQARDTFKEAGQVMEKINTGKGVVGKLINEEETYADLKKTLRGLKDYVTRTQALMLSVDIHSETMLRDSNSKGYFELRLRPNSDCFYMVQLVSDKRGSIERHVRHTVRRDDKGALLNPSNLDIPLHRKVEFAEVVERTVQKKNDILFGLQFGKRFDRMIFRIGLFENTFGVGCDFYVPLNTNWVHWITTLEAFDLSGINRIDDPRPHIKWLNKAFFMKNLYTTFGIDDVVSKRTANPFIGGGFRFSDDDLKYFVSQIPLNRR